MRVEWSGRRRREKVCNPFSCLESPRRWMHDDDAMTIKRNRDWERNKGNWNWQKRPKVKSTPNGSVVIVILVSFLLWGLLRKQFHLEPTLPSQCSQIHWRKSLDSYSFQMFRVAYERMKETWYVIKLWVFRQKYRHEITPSYYILAFVRVWNVRWTVTGMKWGDEVSVNQWI